MGSLRILLVDDEEIVHKTLAPYLRDLGHCVDNASEGSAALELIKANEYDIALVDIRMPGIDGISLLPKIEEIRKELSTVIITAHGSMDIVIQALRMGAADFLTKPVKLVELDAVLEKAVRIRSLRQTERRLRETISGIQTSQRLPYMNQRLVGESKAIKDVREQIQLAVKANCDTILISGETGTGKEVAAREIHFTGENTERPFIAVSCPALPDSLVESELFGHVKGAFTGAAMDKPGYFELADGGTLFLDEISDLSPSAQAKLLRILETRRLRRVGGSREISVNIRVVAATNCPLEKLVETQKFRKDLFYRLNVFTIKLSPLRERTEDIIPLAEYFLSIFMVGRGIQIDGFSKEAQEELLEYDFPGNVRELRNIVERAAILCRSGRIQPGHLNLPKNQSTNTYHSNRPFDEEERKRILDALEKAKWNRRQAAKDMGIPYSSLRFKISKFNIS
ncbi:sigma-54-dependent Fis family transcriptional regulator [bacterium]|nr:sigma-54-dependent Fis family transcriptional regulator [bacterium]